MRQQEPWTDRVIQKWQAWRSADHEDNAVLSRHEIITLLGEIERLHARNAELVAALRDARTGLHNDFEPDNQSKVWHRVNAAVIEAEGREYEPGMNPVDDAEFGMKP